MLTKSRDSRRFAAAAALVALALTWQSALSGLQVVAAPSKGAPQASPGPLTAGKSLYGKNQFEAAVKSFETAVQKDPNNCEAHLCLGRALCKTAGTLSKDSAAQKTMYKRGINELRIAMRQGKGGPHAAAANNFLMNLPRDVVAPRTDADTPLLAMLHGLRGLDRGSDGPKPKVLEFYANWCEPCKMLKPLIEKAKTEYGDQVEFVSYNVDDPAVEQIVEDYEVSPIPTLIFLTPDNQVASYSIGYSGANTVEAGLRKILNKG